MDTLAARPRELEELHCLGRLPDASGALAQAVRDRYRTSSEAAALPE